MRGDYHALLNDFARSSITTMITGSPTVFVELLVTILAFTNDNKSEFSSYLSSCESTYLIVINLIVRVVEGAL